MCLNSINTGSNREPYLLGNHPEFLEVDQAVDPRIVTQVDERQILLDDGVERNLQPAGRVIAVLTFY